MKDFQTLEKLARRKGEKVISVACGEDENILKAIDKTFKEGIARFIITGDKEKIEILLTKLGMDKKEYEIIHCETMEEGVEEAVKIVSSGRANLLMKGLVDTSILLKGVLNKEYGLRKNKVLSHITAFECRLYDKLILATDCAMNIAPDLNGKIELIKNAKEILEALEIEKPKVACICAKEKVSQKMKDTVEARELENLSRNGEFGDLIVRGPLAIDNAVSKEAARVKGIDGDIKGDADLLLMDNINAGNVFYKTMVYLAGAKSAGVVVGGKTPIILTSRADSSEIKFNSILLGVSIC